MGGGGGIEPEENTSSARDFGGKINTGSNFGDVFWRFSEVDLEIFSGAPVDKIEDWKEGKRAAHIAGQMWNSWVWVFFVSYSSNILHKQPQILS